MVPLCTKKSIRMIKCFTLFFVSTFILVATCLQAAPWICSSELGRTRGSPLEKTAFIFCTFVFTSPITIPLRTPLLQVGSGAGNFDTTAVYDVVASGKNSDIVHEAWNSMHSKSTTEIKRTAPSARSCDESNSNDGFRRSANPL